ncbi:hypothetical protein [Amaricoccus sp. W119]|uniref:hypothetical protein n=1 Tax=Amaricoccus sp. W119 TaxID=3391833 RepID=UPI0039A697E7
MILDSYEQFYRAFEVQPRTQAKPVNLRSENPAAAWFAQYAPAFGITPKAGSSK